MTIEPLLAWPRLDEERLQTLRELFPEVHSDGKVDFELLKASLTEAADDTEAFEEHYGLFWPGRQEARTLAVKPPSGALRPMLGEGIDEETTQNSLLIGDNLEILRLLQRGYRSRIKLVYIDPPYNTGEDFIYKDDFSDPVAKYLEATNQADFSGLLTTNPQSSGRFHSRWLTSMSPRLFLARNLLRDDGFCVVSTDDGEVANLRLLMNAIFGEENFIATLVWDRNRKNDAKYFSVGHEYMLVYARSKSRLQELDVVLRAAKEGVDEVREVFDRLRAEHNDDWNQVKAGLREFYRTIPDDDQRKPLARFAKVDERGPYRDDGNINWPGGGGPRYEVPHPITGKPCRLPRSGWRFPTPERFWEEYDKGRIQFGEDETTVPAIRYDLFTSATQVLPTVAYSYAQTAAQRFDAIFDGHRVFDNPKPFDDMAKLVDYLTGPDDTVLDFFAGSGSTGHGVWLANQKMSTYRRFILVQLDESVNTTTTTGRNAVTMGLNTIDAITKERLRRVSNQFKSEEGQGDFGFRVYKLADSNIRAWRNYQGEDIAELETLLTAMQSPLADNWTAENLVVEILLREGYPLDSQTKRLTDFSQNVVWQAVHPLLQTEMLMCFDDRISAETLEHLEAHREGTFYCLEQALDDQTKLQIIDRITKVKTL